MGQYIVPAVEYFVVAIVPAVEVLAFSSVVVAGQVQIVLVLAVDLLADHQQK